LETPPGGRPAVFKASGAPVPCDLFRRVQKRDGTIVDFDPSKISAAIYKAAQSVGGKDRNRAETLKEYVILDLARGHQESTSLLHIELIQDSIEKVLVENGHYRTARAFITYRNERARRRILRGEAFAPSHLEDGTETLCDASVWISSGDSIRWDREKIVKALVRETSLPYDDARKVSHAVEKEIVHSKISRLTASLIRELTNAQLLQMGYEKERRLHSRLGLPIYDVEARLLGRERTGERSVEAEILRQYAVEKVLPLSVCELHGQRDIHVHDLEWIHRPIELQQDLDLKECELWPVPKSFRGERESSAPAWEEFLATWEREESRLLRVVGKRLIWRSVNSAIAFHAQAAGINLSEAVHQALRKVWRHAGNGAKSPKIVWRLHETVPPKWKGKYIGAQQLSLLPGDEFETACRTALLETLARIREVGPYWSACGLEIEVVLDARAKSDIGTDLLQAVSESIASGAPVRVLFSRETAVAHSAETQDLQLFQTISLNFPRAAVVAEGNDNRLVEWLEDRLSLVAEAHLSKKTLLERILKSRSLAPLSLAGETPGEGLPFRFSETLAGVGLWGLEEMALIHRGKSPSEDEETLRWVLQVIARLGLRMREVGDRMGLRLAFVSNTSQQVIDRLCRNLQVDCLAGHYSTSEHLIDFSGGIEEKLKKEGKIAPFLAFGQQVSTLETTQPPSAEEARRLIEFSISETHVSGLSWIGCFSYCRECGTRSSERERVCGQCGSERLYEVHREKQGSHTTIARL
jgi:ribonucleoside-triphosphate reductase